MTYSTKEYRLRVYVANNTDKSTYIKSITVVDTETGENQISYHLKIRMKKMVGKILKKIKP